MNHKGAKAQRRQIDLSDLGVLVPLWLVLGFLFLSRIGQIPIQSDPIGRVSPARCKLNQHRSSRALVTGDSYLRVIESQITLD